MFRQRAVNEVIIPALLHSPGLSRFKSSLQLFAMDESRLLQCLLSFLNTEVSSSLRFPSKKLLINTFKGAIRSLDNEML